MTEARPFAAPHFDALLGHDVFEWTAERVRSRIVITQQHTQPYGIVHGGVYCAIIESVASHGAAAAAQTIPGVVGVVGVNNTTDFLRSHQDGPLEAEGTPVHVGRSQQLWQVVITRPSDGKPVARGQVRLQHLTTLPKDR